MEDTAEELLRMGFERVHTEIERYNGPWLGVADVHGAPHYFSRTSHDDRYFVWPVDEETFALERETWLIYIAWLRRYHAGETPKSHPTDNGDVRYDELEALAKPRRAVPDDAHVLQAEWGDNSDLLGLVAPEGPDYLVRWSEPA
ncbi:hypothetical protein [Kutzneria sp. NPDC052558]|uniref:hypothetical protein n=1 Tax=Kutzneria sp. NPDC052558 TaxID=3364121 RepID=UPI0037C5B8A8